VIARFTKTLLDRWYWDRDLDDEPDPD